eukprot:6070236-Alexandrium_andersonii.AAC.1
MQSPSCDGGPCTARARASPARRGPGTAGAWASLRPPGRRSVRRESRRCACRQRCPAEGAVDGVTPELGGLGVEVDLNPSTHGGEA